MAVLIQQDLQKVGIKVNVVTLDFPSLIERISQSFNYEAASSDPNRRKKSFDQVQQIVVEQAPFIFLVNWNALSAVSTSVQGATPVILRPHKSGTAVLREQVSR